MSEFDKEAEREKLREKYEKEKEDRKATQRMSDLLLKGARMTNKHCGVCADPFFEMDDTLFCPSCHGGPEGVEASVEPDDATEEPTPTTDTADESIQEDADGDEASPDPADNRIDVTPRRSESIDGKGTEVEPGLASDVTDTSEPSLNGIQADLERTIERFTREAATTDDPRHAKECLEAAKAASETLATLR